MLQKVRSKLTYANVMATVAVFLALGGAAYAVSIAPKNSVVSKSIKNGQVKKPDLGANSVNTGKVIDGSLLKQDFMAGQLPQGPKGDPGPGAISIPITHVDAGTSETLRTIHGIDVRYSCTASTSKVTVEVQRLSPYSTVYVSGEKAEDGVLSPLNTSGSDVEASGSSIANLDVIATADGTWNRIDLGGYGGGGSNGCNVWGLVIPGT